MEVRLLLDRLRRHPAAGPPAGRAGGPEAGPRPVRVEVRLATDEAGEILS